MIGCGTAGEFASGGNHGRVRLATRSEGRSGPAAVDVGLARPVEPLSSVADGGRLGWRCLEIGAGNGSLSQWLAQRVGPTGHVIATDIRTDLMQGIAGSNLRFASSTSCTTSRPTRRMTSSPFGRCCTISPNAARLSARLRAGSSRVVMLFIQEPDFYPTWTVEPPSQNHFWEAFIRWAASPSDRLLRRAQNSRMASADGHGESPPKGTPFSIRRIGFRGMVGRWDARSRGEAANARAASRRDAR